jgi:arabinose-5-phosphate isomerase
MSDILDHPFFSDSQNLLTLGRKILEQEASALEGVLPQLDPQLLQAALKILFDCEGMIMVCGAGTSSSIARRLAHILTCSGRPAFFLDSGQCQHGYSAIVRPSDVLIAISRGGETDDLNYLLDIARSQGAKVIGIMENLESTMAKLCDVTLSARVDKENDALGVIPLASTLAHAAVGDILVAALGIVLGFDANRFSRVHPGGAVGKRLSQRSET